MATLDIRCKVCDEGKLKKKKLYKRSIPVVILGYVFLLPSLLGILLSGFMVILTYDLEEYNNEIKDKTIKQLVSVGVKLDDAQHILLKKSESEVDDYLSNIGYITDEQVSEIKSTLNQFSIDTKTDFIFGMDGLVGSSYLMFVPLLIISITSGLVGWLFTVKKKVLKCSTCEAVINAS